MRFRSLLYTPGTRGDRYQKALQEGSADIVAADLEDAVAPADKAAARHQVLQALRAVPSGKAVRAVRINAWPGRWAEEDLAAVLPGQPDLLVVPKCEDVEAIEALDAHLEALERKAGLEGGHVRLVLILETAKGLLQGAALCEASDRTVAVCFGAEDLAADAGIRREPTNWTVSVPRAWVPIQAASAGVAALDMVTADVKDLERVRREAREARDLGYRGKMCIHPEQAKAVQEAFRPAEDEVAWARKVMAAVQAGGVGAGGVVVVDGRMVDIPVVRQAERVLRDATP